MSHTLTYRSDEAPAPSPEVDNQNPRMSFGELPDPYGRYESFKKNPIYCGYEMDLPPVFDAGGILVHPTKYNDVIPNDTLVAVRGSMKM